MSTLWRNREFNLLWISQALSDVGTTTATLAVPLLVLAATGSAVQAGVVGTVAQLVQLLARLPAGVLSDHFDRRRILLACDAVRLIGYAALAVAVFTGHARLHLIVAVVILDAIGTTLFDTTERAALRSIVPAADLPDAVARNDVRAYASSLAGPPLGGMLFGLAPALPFVGNAVSFLASLTGVAMIRKPLQTTRARFPVPHGTALAEGVRFVFTEPFLRAVVLIAAPLNFAVTGTIFTVILTLQAGGTEPGVIGLAQTVVAAGGLAGALAAPGLRRRFPLALLIRLICWIAPVVLAISPLLSPGIAAAGPVALAVFLAPAIDAALLGYQAAITPDHLQGRVLSVITLSAKSAVAVAPLLAGVLVTAWGSRIGLLVFASAMLVAAVTSTFGAGIRSMRKLGEPVPPA